MLPSSHLLMYGLLESGNVQVSVRVLIQKKVVRAFHIAQHVGPTSQEKQGVGNQVQKKLKTTLKTGVAKVYSFEELKGTLEYPENNASKGKVLLKF